MKLIINENRTTTSLGQGGTQNENNYEVIDFIFPEKLENYNKRIVYYLEDERVWDAIINNRASLTNAITKYEKVKAYVWLTNGETITLKYVCDGTEEGSYYFTYDNVEYYFTMPEIVENDELIFDVSTSTLKLGETIITTSSTGTGTELTFSTIIDAEEDFRSKLFDLEFYENENATKLTPTEEEVDGFNTMLTAMNDKIAEMNQIEEEVNNINISATKVDHTATITITNMDGSTESVEIYDGTAGDLSDYYNKEETNTLLDAKANTSDLATVAFSGKYDDLTDKPVVPGVPTKTSDLENDSGFITKDVNNLTNYELKTNTGSTIAVTMDSSFVLSVSLKNSAGTVLNTQTVDLPLESVVVGGSYDSVNKKIVLVLENGNTIDVPVGDLVSGLQTEITSQNKLLSDLVDDTNQTNKFVTASDKTSWNGKLDSSKVKSAYSTTSGDVYDVDYINSTVGNIESILETLDIGSGV